MSNLFYFYHEKCLGNGMVQLPIVLKYPRTGTLCSDKSTQNHCELYPNKWVVKWESHVSHRQFFFGMDTDFHMFVTKNCIFVFLLFPRYWKPLKVPTDEMHNIYIEAQYFQLIVSWTYQLLWHKLARWEWDVKLHGLAWYLYQNDIQKFSSPC